MACSPLGHTPTVLTTILSHSMCLVSSRENPTAVSPISGATYWLLTSSRTPYTLRQVVPALAAASSRRVLAAHGGRIYTMDPNRPPAEALLSMDGRVIFVGSDGELRRLAPVLGDSQVLDLQGRCVVPGLTDSHIHFLTYGLNLDRVELTGAASLAEVQDRLRRAGAALAPDEWLQGWGWDHSLWPEARFPDRAALDAAVPHAPVALKRKDGHLLWVNSAALAAAAVTRETPDPPGGRIGRDASGEPDGLLFESAGQLVTQAIPPITAPQAAQASRRAMTDLHRLGVTGIHVPEDATSFRTLQALDSVGELRLRVTIMLPYTSLPAALDTGLRTGFGSDFLRVGPVKMFADGSLGSETAAMLHPFEGGDNQGILILPPGEIGSAISRAARGGLACAIHAIGDRANRVVLDAFQMTRDQWAPVGLRQRIEHVQVLHPADVPRLGQLGVIASVQPIHATQDMDLVERLWGARGRYAYAFRSLLDTGAVLAFGSDAPVETADPLAGLYAAVARRRSDGRPADAWYPEERITAAEAIHAYTRGAAYAAGLERLAGTLSPGMQADFTVFSHDVVAGVAEDILAARVTTTVVDGEIVYSR
jgi:predicted amidohydrolase YtcJ